MKHLEIENYSLLDVLNRLQNHYRNLHSEMDVDQAMHSQEFGGLVQVDSWVPIFASSTATSIVDTMRDQLRTGTPVVSFRPTGNSQAARKHQTLMERWGQSFMDNVVRDGEVDPFQQGVHNKLLRGASCYKLRVDIDKIVDAPKSGDYLSDDEWMEALHEWRNDTLSYDTFTVDAVDPRAVYPCPGAKFPLPYLLEVHEKPYGEVMEEWPEWEVPEPEEGTYPETATIIQAWSSREYRVEIEGTEVLRVENPLGIVPYVFSYSGLGRENYDGDPKYLGVSILRPVRGELIEEVRLKTAMAAQWQLHVFPRMITMENPDKIKQLWDMSPGGILQVTNPALPPQWIDTPPPNEAMLIFLNEIKGAIEAKSRPVLEGKRPVGVDFGYMQALLIGQARLQLDAVKKSLDADGTKMLNLAARIMNRLGFRMTVEARVGVAERDRAVSGDDFKTFNFKMSFDSVTPEENERLLLLGRSLLAAGAITKRTFLKEFAKNVVESPEEEEVQRLYELAIEQYIAAGGLMQVLAQEDRVAQEEEKLGEMQGEIEERIGGAASQVQTRMRELKRLGPLGAPTGPLGSQREEVF